MDLAGTQLAAGWASGVGCVRGRVNFNRRRSGINHFRLSSVPWASGYLCAAMGCHSLASGVSLWSAAFASQLALLMRVINVFVMRLLIRQCLNTVSK